MEYIRSLSLSRRCGTPRSRVGPSANMARTDRAGARSGRWPARNAVARSGRGPLPGATAPPSGLGCQRTGGLATLVADFGAQGPQRFDQPADGPAAELLAAIDPVAAFADCQCGGQKAQDG